MKSDKKLSFPLLKYFSIVSLVCVLAAAITLILMYRYQSINSLIWHGEQSNAALTQALSNTIWPELRQFALKADKLNKEELVQHPVIKATHKSIAAQIKNTPVLKVKIFNMSGKTIYSTDENQLAIQKPKDYPGSVSAKTGKMISKFSERDTFNSVRGLLSNRKIVSSYLPIQNEENEIEGVFEVYLDVTDQFDSITTEQNYAFLVIVTILALLYITLLYVVVRANRIIEKQSIELDKSFQEIEQKSMDIKVARDQAMDASKAKSTFLANMSHELRTPLNAIIGYSELMLEDADASENKDDVNDLEKIYNSGKHLLSLINNILDISKIEAGKMENFLEEVFVKNVLDIAIDNIRTDLAKNGNTIECNIESNIGAMFTDETKLKQILLNLLSNANKFTKNGKISVDVKLTNSTNSKWIEIIVADSGIGMSQEQVLNLFQVFMQADDSTTKKYGGTGLGLAITRHLCELLGGGISVKSVLKEGTSFTAKLPMTSPELVIDREQKLKTLGDMVDPAIVRFGSKVARLNSNRKKVSRVLVIDDDEYFLELMGRYLARKGYYVDLATNADDGISMAGSKDPDVVVLDILMPHKDGWYVLSEFKKNSKLSKLPVIILSFIDDKELGYAMGASDYILKPLDWNSLEKSINKIVRID